jgi:hypothetical protein
MIVIVAVIVYVVAAIAWAVWLDGAYRRARRESA